MGFRERWRVFSRAPSLSRARGRTSTPSFPRTRDRFSRVIPRTSCLRGDAAGEIAPGFSENIGRRCVESSTYLAAVIAARKRSPAAFAAFAHAGLSACIVRARGRAIRDEIRSARSMHRSRRSSSELALSETFRETARLSPSPSPVERWALRG